MVWEGGGREAAPYPDSLAGELDEALNCLERAVDLGLTQKGWFEHDSNLDPLRQLARFKSLMEKLG